MLWFCRVTFFSWKPLHRAFGSIPTFFASLFYYLIVVCLRTVLNGSIKTFVIIILIRISLEMKYVTVFKKKNYEFCKYVLVVKKICFKKKRCVRKMHVFIYKVHKLTCNERRPINNYMFPSVHRIRHTDIHAGL